MTPLHETDAQAALWAVFMLAGIFCALMTDLLRLLLGAFRADACSYHIISQTQKDCILSGSSDANCENDGATQNIFTHFVTFGRFFAKFRCHSGKWSDLFAGFFSGALTALIAAAVSFICANGRAQPYMALAMAAGAALYHAILGRLLGSARLHFLRIFGALSARIASSSAVRRIFR